MKIKSIIAVALAATVAFASCSKDNTNSGVPGGETASVKIKFSYAGEQGNSRANAAPITGGVLELQAGHIFFTTPDGTIDTHVGIGNTAGISQVSLANLKGNETVIKGIASNVNKCYIVSNDVAAGIGGTTGITGNLRGSNISTVLLNHELEVSDLNNAAGNVATVPLFGVGDLVKTPGTTTTGQEDYDASVNVEINSLTSRIQLNKITGISKTYTDGNSTEQTVTINAFTVEGIYVNVYYPKMLVSSATPYPSAIVNNGQTPANYSKTGATTYASGASGEKLADEPNLTATANVAAPSNGTWAYNVFPTPAATQTDVPHIVIKLSSVTFTDSANGTPVTLTDQFITIHEMKYGTGGVETPGTVVTSFKANNIYTLGDVKFDYTHLSSIPEAESIDVLVTVQMMSWVNNPVDWNN